MKWMLIVVVFELAPIKTDLMFDDLGKCMVAADKIRRTYEKEYNSLAQSAKQLFTGDEYAGFETFISWRTLKNALTCIPHATP